MIDTRRSIRRAARRGGKAAALKASRTIIVWDEVAPVPAEFERRVAVAFERRLLERTWHGTGLAAGLVYTPTNTLVPPPLGRVKVRFS